VKFASLGADLDRYRSLIAGIVDAAVVSNEFETIMPSNIKVLMKGSAVVPKFIRLCVATSSKVLAERRDDLVRFVAAERYGMFWQPAQLELAGVAYLLVGIIFSSIPGGVAFVLQTIGV